MGMADRLDAVPVFREAGRQTRQQLAQSATSKKVKAKQVLFRTREEVEYLYVVQAGYAVLEKANKNNNKRGIFVLGAGSLLNEVVLEEGIASIDCYALTDLTVLAFPIPAFREIMKSDWRINQWVLESMAQKIRRLYRQLENTTKMMPLEKQVSMRMIKFGRDFGVPDGDNGDSLRIPFPVTITFLSELVGSNRESVSRVVKKLSGEGYFAIQNGKCVIYDLEGLRKYVAR